MSLENIMIQKPKKKISYYLIIIGCVLFSVLITKDLSWFNEIMFGVIVLAFLRIMYDKLKSNDKSKFKLETQYDLFNSLVLAIFGIGMIVWSFMNLDFFVKFNLEWINYLLIGLIFIFGALTNRKSLIFNPKSSELIEIEDYTLTLDSNIKQIQLFKNKMIVSKTETENYAFDELNITEEDTLNFSNWIYNRIPNCQMHISWKS